MLRKFRNGLKPSGWLMVGTVISGLFSYVSLAVSARLLGAGDFGLLGTLLGVSAFAGVLLRPAGYAATHLAILASTRSGIKALRGLMGLSLLVGGVLAVVLLIILLLVAQPLSATLQTSGFLPIALLAPLLATAASAQITGGLVSGVQEFSWLAGASVVEAAVRALSIGPLSFIFGVSGALASYALGQAAAVHFSVARMGGIAWSLPPARDVIEGLKTGGSAVSLLAGITLLQNGDLVLLRSYGAPVDTGLYAACASAGNLFVMLSAPLYLPAFPRAFAAHRRGDSTLPILLTALIPIGAAGVVLVVAAAAIGAFAMKVVFGTAFEGAGQLLPIYLTKTTMLLLAGCTGQHVIAIGLGRTVHIGLPLALAGLATLALLRPSPQTTAELVLVTAAALSMSLGIAALLGRSGIPHPQ